MRVVYLAHPLSGDVIGNLASAKRWVRWVETAYPDFAVVASWIVECEIWDDSDPEHRAAGLARDLAVIERCESLVLVGGRVSEGMAAEQRWAMSRGIPVLDLTHLGAEPPSA